MSENKKSNKLLATDFVKGRSENLNSYFLLLKLPFCFSVKSAKINNMSAEKLLYYEFGEYQIDALNGQLLRNGKVVVLTQKSFEILLFLVQNRDRVIKKTEVFEKIWTDTFVEEATLTQHIYMLRKVFKENSNDEIPIETIPKLGYRFVGEVKEVCAEIEEKKVREDLTFAAPRKRNSATIGAFLSLLILSLSVFLYLVNGKDKTLKIRSIAVMPFHQIHSEKDDKMGLGMADILISQLGRLENVQITPTSSIIRYAENENFDIFEAGKSLNVDAVLTASTQCDGEVVRVSYQLHNVKDKQLLLSEKFDERHENIFSLQDKISKQIFYRLSQEIKSKQESNENPQYTQNIEAFQIYSKGLFNWNKQTPDGRAEAAGYFAEAAKLDPNFAEAYAYLADTYSLAFFYGEKINNLSGSDLANKSKENANKALELKPNCAEAMTALSIIYFNESKKTEAQYLLQKAIAIKPNDATVQKRINLLFPNRETEVAAY